HEPVPGRAECQLPHVLMIEWIARGVRFEPASRSPYRVDTHQERCRGDRRAGATIIGHVRDVLPVRAPRRHVRKPVFTTKDAGGVTNSPKVHTAGATRAPDLVE